MTELKQGPATICNLFREDIDFLYFAVPGDKTKRPEIKGIGLPITEAAERNSEYLKQKQRKRNPTK